MTSAIVAKEGHPDRTHEGNGIRDEQEGNGEKPADPEVKLHAVDPRPNLDDADQKVRYEKCHRDRSVRMMEKLKSDG